MSTLDSTKRFWFTHKTMKNIEVYDKKYLEEPVLVTSQDNWSEVADSDMWEDYVAFADRPESRVGSPIDDLIDFSAPQNNAPELLKSIYTELLTGAICLRAFQATRDVKKGEAIAEKIIKYLDSTDFFTAPASTRYHESVPCGLVFHSLKVYNEATTLQYLPAFADCNVCKWALVALVHDWCKIGLYERYTRNVKNESTGQWEKVPSFKIADVKHNNTLGHGAASMFMISQFLRLSFEEALAIRWHMGTWNVCDSEFNDLQDSNENYPLVHMIQFADQLAITTYESARYAKERNK